MTDLVDQLKNPVVQGCIAAIVTYLYLWWKEKCKQKKHPEARKRPVNIMIPGLVGAIVWLISCGCQEGGGGGGSSSSRFGSSGESIDISTNKPTIVTSTVTNTTNKVVPPSMVGGVVVVPQPNLDGSVPLLGSTGVAQIFPIKRTDNTGNDSFHIVGKNRIRLPPTDVFQDLADFN